VENRPVRLNPLPGLEKAAHWQAQRVARAKTTCKRYDIVAAVFDKGKQ